MPEKLIGSILRGLSNFLITLGTPPFFALKILAWSIFWFARLLTQITTAVVALVVSVGETAIWLARTVLTAILTSFDYLGNRLTLFFKKTRRQTVQSAKNIRKSLPNFSGKLQQINHNLTRLWLTLSQKISKLSTTFTKKDIVVKKSIVKKTMVTNAQTAIKDRILFFSLGLAICFAVFFVPYWLRNTLNQLPNPKILATRDISVSTKIYDRNKILLYQIYSNENRSIIKLSELPKNLVNATIAIEDTKFYEHWGIDPKGIVRALFSNSTGGQFQGGSTITQQLVKSALLSPERTLTRKLKEIILSFWTERTYGKQEILEMYFNQVPYGGAAYGIEAAAQTYFNKHARDLDLAESAMIAGLPAAPTIYSPFSSHPELTKERQRQVLDAMVKQKYIDQFAADEALNEKLKLAPLESEIKAPHFVLYVKDYLTKKYGLRAVEQGGLEVITSLDYLTYEKVNQMVRDGVEKQKYLSVGNGAALVTNPKTGEILAMVGSTNYFDQAHDGNVNVTISQRSPGSSIKPLGYALALEKNLINSATIIDDAPIVFNSVGSPPYAPQNYDNRFHGRVSVRTALASSLNIPAVKIMEKTGVTNFLEFAKKMGITTFTDPSRYGLSISLGGGEIKMEDMVVAFSTFANNGERVDLKPVLSVTDYRWHVLENNRETKTSEKVISSKTAFLISSILSDDNARALTFGHGSILNIPNHTVAVKTGTTQEKRDNWTIGYTPTMLAAIWVGNNNNSPMSPYLESGQTGAAAIWSPIMTELLKDKPNEPVNKPDDVISVKICQINGLLACEFCPFVSNEYFTKGTEPTTACNFTKEDLDRMNKEREDREKAANEKH